MVRAGGSASRAINDRTHLTQVGVIIRLGDDRRMILIDPDGLRANMVSQPWGASIRPRRNDVIPGSDSVVVERNSAVDSIMRSERDGGLWAPLGSFGAQYRRCPMRNAAGRDQRAGTTGGSSTWE